MRKYINSTLICIFLLINPIISTADVDWVLDILPGTILANFAADDFEVTGPNGRETPSMLSSMPNGSFGVAFQGVDGYFEVKGGGGVLLNSKISASMAYLTAGLYLELRPSIFFGPHAYYTSFGKPEWWGDTEIEFSATTGYIIGVHLTAGDKISYLLSVDYCSQSFDIDKDKTAPGITYSDDELNLSGIAVQFGVTAMF